MSRCSVKMMKFLIAVVRRPEHLPQLLEFGLLAGGVELLRFLVQPGDLCTLRLQLSEGDCHRALEGLTLELLVLLPVLTGPLLVSGSRLKEVVEPAETLLPPRQLLLGETAAADVVDEVFQLLKAALEGA